MNTDLNYRVLRLQHGNGMSNRWDRQLLENLLEWNGFQDDSD